MRPIRLLLTRKKSLLPDAIWVLRAWMPCFLVLECVSQLRLVPLRQSLLTVKTVFEEANRICTDKSAAR